MNKYEIGIILTVIAFTILTFNYSLKAGSVMVYHGCAEYNKTTGNIYWLGTGKKF